MQVELGDSIELEQRPQYANSPYALSDTSCQTFDLLGIGTLFG
jgi:hypothetical protein